MLRITDIQENRVNWTTVPRCECPNPQKYLLQAGDIVIARTGATTGKSFFLQEVPEPSVFASYLIRVQAGDAISPEYLAKYMLSPSYWAQISVVSKGTAQPGANASILGELDIPVPPLDEQRRIVAKLDALQARSRRAREALDAVPPLIEKLRQSILAAAFRGDLTKDWRAKNPNVEPASELLKRIRIERRKKWEEAELAKMVAKGKPPTDDRWKAKYKEPEPVDTIELPELPEGWCWAAAEEVVDPGADIVYGIVQPGPTVTDGVPYVRGMDIQDGTILESQLLCTSRAIADRYARASLRGGDVLLGIIRATKVAVVPESLTGANITQGTARFRPAGGLQTQYLAAWLECRFAQQWLHARYRGIDMPGLNLQDVRRLPVALAPSTEQVVITSRLRTTSYRTRSVTNAAMLLQSAQSRLDRAMLASAFRGTLSERAPAPVCPYDTP
jgi:type I restriction enzyme S subunit